MGLFILLYAQLVANIFEMFNFTKWLIILKEKIALLGGSDRKNVWR
jgi:hypothetical protein